MTSLNTSPYTVKRPLYDYASINYASIMYDGKVVYQASDEDSQLSIERHAQRLNDAFIKGVETERARCLLATNGLPVPYVFSARNLIRGDVLPSKHE